MIPLSLPPKEPRSWKEKLLGWRDVPQNEGLLKLRYMKAANAQEEGRDMKRERERLETYI